MNALYFYLNAAIFLAYNALTLQLFLLVRRHRFAAHINSKHKQRLKVTVYLISGLFAAFIFLCGSLHGIHAILYCYDANTFTHNSNSNSNSNSYGNSYSNSYSNSDSNYQNYYYKSIIDNFHIVTLALCALVSVTTAIASYKLFPTISDVLSKLELNEQGKLEHLTEMVDQFQDSVAILTPNLTIIRGNPSSTSFFGSNYINTDVHQYIHSDDVQNFDNAILKAVSSYADPIACVEYRINKLSFGKTNREYRSNSCLNTKNTDGIDIPNSNSNNNSNGNSNSQSEVELYTLSKKSINVPDDVSYDNSNNICSSNDDPNNFIWVESRICKNSIDGVDNYRLNMITRDITDKKKLAQSKDEEEKNTAKFNYIACVAHDLKTPLHSFAMTTELLKEKVVNEEQLSLLDDAAVAVDLMRLTISQTMDINKAISGSKLVPHCCSVSITAILKKVSTIIDWYSKQVPICYHISDEISDMIISDEEWLWQILLNYLTNACKYTEEGSITVSVELSSETLIDIDNSSTYNDNISSNRNNNINLSNTKNNKISPSSNQRNRQKYLLFSVADTGVGISTSKMSSLFSAFGQMQEGAATGTGLGLFGLKSRVLGLGGQCGAYPNRSSSNGSGTVFWFTIPFIEDTNTLYETQQQKQKLALDFISLESARRNSMTSFSRSSIECRTSSDSTPLATSPCTFTSKANSPLEVVHPISIHTTFSDDDNANNTTKLRRTAIVVDDMASIRKLMVKILEKVGFTHIECYQNGCKGLSAMKNKQVDAVFTDIQMPIMSGPEMAERFREYENETITSGKRTRRQLIIAVSANSTDKSLSPKNSNVFDYVLGKPLQICELENILKHHFEDEQFNNNF